MGGATVARMALDHPDLFEGCCSIRPILMGVWHRADGLGIEGLPGRVARAWRPRRCPDPSSPWIGAPSSNATWPWRGSPLRGSLRSMHGVLGARLAACPCPPFCGARRAIDMPTLAECRRRAGLTGVARHRASPNLQCPRTWWLFQRRGICSPRRPGLDAGRWRHPARGRAIRWPGNARNVAASDSGRRVARAAAPRCRPAASHHWHRDDAARLGPPAGSWEQADRVRVGRTSRPASRRPRRAGRRHASGGEHG